MKVLLMAYECSPYRGSEWAVGWGRLLEAARVAETHVVTSESNYKALERARDEGLIPAGVKFYTPEPDAALREMEKKPALFAYNYTAYHHWQELAIGLVRELHARERFDVVHQVNVCTFREPGYAWELNVPFLWGPVGGSQNFPVRFLTMLPAKEAFKEFARGVSNWLSLRMKKRVRAAAKRAAVIVAANSTNRRDYERAFGRKVELLLETGLRTVEEPDRARFLARVADKDAGREARPLKILWSGELQTRKALPILLRALARVRVRFELKVLGDGPMREIWVEEARRLGLGVVERGSRKQEVGSSGGVAGEVVQPGSENPDPGHPSVPLQQQVPFEDDNRKSKSNGQSNSNGQSSGQSNDNSQSSGEGAGGAFCSLRSRLCGVDSVMDVRAAAGKVEFLGRLPFVEAVAAMQEAELFCFTSLRDTSGNVVLEALAAGVPVVCFDHQGPGDMVSSTSGVKLKVTSPGKAVEEWARVIEELARDPRRLLDLSEGATVQAKRFLWDRNGDWVNAVYARLAGVAKGGFAAKAADETMGA